MRGIVDEIVSRFTGTEVAKEGKATYQNLFAFAPAVICVVGAPYDRRRTGRSARRTPSGTRRAGSR